MDFVHGVDPHASHAVMGACNVTQFAVRSVRALRRSVGFCCSNRTPCTFVRCSLLSLTQHFAHKPNMEAGKQAAHTGIPDPDLPAAAEAYAKHLEKKGASPGEQICQHSQLPPAMAARGNLQ